MTRKKLKTKQKIQLQNKSKRKPGEKESDKHANHSPTLAGLTQQLQQADLLNQRYAMWLHEMRSPLLVLQQGLVNIKPSEISPNHQAWWSMVESATQQLNQNINDLLSLSQLKNHAILLQNQPFNLTALLRAVHLMAKTLLADKPITLTCDVPTEAVWLQGDAFRLTQVLSNLLSNAIKFTAHGEIKFSVQEIGSDHYEFTVADSGCGLSTEQQQALFQPFQQFLQTSSGAQAGSGLGLFIVHNLVDAMQGRIKVESTLGKGTQFIVTIELKAAQPPTQTVVSNIMTPSNDVLTVLLADDSALSRQFVINLLADQPVEIVEAVDGDQAEEALQKTEFDYVLLDQFMPGIDGEKVCHTIRRIQAEKGQAKLKAVYLISAEQVSVSEGNTCFDKILLKPLEKMQLLQLLSLKQATRAKKAEKDFCKEIIHVNIPPELIGMLPQLTKEVEKILSDLQKALMSSNQTEVGDLIHRLKGSFMLFQLNEMTQLVDDLQQLMPNELTPILLNQLEKIAERFSMFKSSHA